ncbi:MAG: YitT family protein [Candidatus Gastranaerophilales bacterium]|nr:YitT family protein [Candidatus Gastranaerophilales bacterium]
MKEFSINVLFNTIGAFLAAFALECFLVPNQVIDGGIVGISIMVSYITKLNLGIFLVVLNIPFLILALNEFGKKFIALAFYSVGMLALFVNLVSNNIPVITNDLLLSALFGGGILGMGVGIVLKNNACMDGTEILAMKISKKFPYSVGEIIMFINIFIFICAGFLYGWEQAMYSTLTYLIAYKAIDTIVQGLSEEKSIRIISDKGHELGQAIIEKLNKTVTYIEAQGGYSKAQKTMIYCIVPRIELYKLKELVVSMDENAFLSIENVHEVYGKRYKK